MQMPQSTRTVSIAVAILSLALVYLLPSPIDPKPISFIGDIPKLEGVLAVNTHLHKVRRLADGDIRGPESFTAGPDGSIYTGAADGKIWRIKDGELTLVTRTGIEHADCGSYELEAQCGRPKGMKVDSSGRLVVADAYKGILRIDVNTGDTEILLDKFKGSHFRFLNGLDIAADGTIYFTDSTTKWERRDYRYEVIETNQLGRVIALDPKKGVAELVIDNLYLANGIAVSDDGSYLIVAEMSVARISKIYLKGPKRHQRETLIDNLPGYPDNIKRNDRGNYLVGMGSVRLHGLSPIGPFLDVVGPYPAIKRLIVKLVPASLFDLFLPKHALLLEIDPKGQIVTSHHDPGAKVIPAISEAYQYKDKVYFGSFKINFVGVADVKDLYPEK